MLFARKTGDGTFRAFAECHQTFQPNFSFWMVDLFFFVSNVFANVLRNSDSTFSVHFPPATRSCRGTSSWLNESAEKKIYTIEPAIRCVPPCGLSMCKIAIAVAAIIFILPPSHSYPYNLTVFFNEYTDFEVYSAKLKLRIFGRNISEQIFLSKE